MGMYTELHLNVELKLDTPQDVLDVLQFMLQHAHPAGEEKPASATGHPLFDTPRWDFMLRCDSYYFPADTHSTLRYDDIARTHFLNIQCNLKNYDDQISQFLDWITPHVSTRGFAGYWRYKEDDEPTHIYVGGD